MSAVFLLSSDSVGRLIGNGAECASPFHHLLIVGWAAWGILGRLAKPLFLIHSHLKWLFPLVAI